MHEQQEGIEVERSLAWGIWTPSSADHWGSTMMPLLLELLLRGWLLDIYPEPLPKLY